MKRWWRDVLEKVAVVLRDRKASADLGAIAEEAYVYGYPLVLMSVTRRVGTNVPAPMPDKSAAPINQFVHRRAFPDPAFNDVVRPNADTLYSVAWLDLSKGPVVLHVPDTAGRYYVMPLLDAFTNVFASIGKRTTGTGERDFAIVGPGYRGEIPRGVSRIEAPTDTVWILGRTQTNGKADYPAVHAIQDQYRLIPLRAWGTPYTPPTDAAVDPSIDRKTAPMDQVARMDAATFFSILTAELARNPPPARDAEALARFARLGITPGADLDLARLDPVEARALEASVGRGKARIEEAARALGVMENGWHVMRKDIGAYGTSYDARAAIALRGLGANLPEDAIYPLTFVDAEGKPLSGDQRYRIHFPAGEDPPAQAFWSVTMYDAEGFFVENPLGRYAIGDRDAMQRNADGSLDIHIQRASPGSAAEPNWLPAPEGPFNLILRIYWPREAALNGTWRPPPVTREPLLA